MFNICAPFLILRLPFCPFLSFFNNIPALRYPPLFSPSFLCQMLQTLELSFRKMEGYMFKRAPRATDSDKSNLRRMMTPHWKTLFKKRYFVLEPSQKMLYYYADMSKQQVLGSLDLQQVRNV